MKKNMTVLTIVLLFSQLATAASEKFKAEKNCGSAKVVSGDTCSNVKVQLDFAGCSIKSESIVAPKIVCKEKQIKARYAIDNYRYEAIFEKQDDGWGGVTWKQTGSGIEESKKITVVTQKAKEHPVVVAAPVKTPAPAAAETPTVTAAPVAAVASAASSFQFSGYFDFGLNNLSVSNGANFTGGPESGFTLQDGAIYVGYQKDKLSFVLDVPFRRQENRDLGVTTAPNASNSNNAIFGADKFQLYAKYKINDEADVVIGQFDTIFGVEVNDSKDRYFEKTGLVYDSILPVTHAGAMFEYTKSGAYFKGFAADPNNKGSLGTSTGNQGDTNYEYGGAVGYSNDNVRGQVGGMTRPVNKADLENGGKRNLLDVTAGATWKSFSIDFEYANLSDDSKNTLTSLNSTDVEKAGTGFLALASYQITEPLSVGARYEQTSNDPSQQSWKAVQAVAGGIHYRFNPSLEVRAEYIGYQYKNVDTTSFTANRATIAGLFFF